MVKYSSQVLNALPLWKLYSAGKNHKVNHGDVIHVVESYRSSVRIVVIDLFKSIYVFVSKCYLKSYGIIKIPRLVRLRKNAFINNQMSVIRTEKCFWLSQKMLRLTVPADPAWLKAQVSTCCCRGGCVGEAKGSPGHHLRDSALWLVLSVCSLGLGARHMVWTRAPDGPPNRSSSFAENCPPLPRVP